MALSRTFRLNTGALIPAVGFGTWQSKSTTVKIAVDCALKTGYRHIDTAYAYNNEKEIGEAIANSNIPREKLFITTKLWNTFHAREDVQPAFELSLKNLGLDYIDLYLMHWPLAIRKNECLDLEPKKPDGTFDWVDIDYAEVWSEMEKIDPSKVKAIGVSNFSIGRLERLISKARIIPAVNQVELHPYLPQWKLLEFCKENNIHVTAYSPLGSTNAPLLTDPTLTAIAKSNQKSIVQVLISWAVQRGTSVLPKSVTPSRIKANFNDFLLPEKDFELINKITTRTRYLKPKGYPDVFGDDF
ncbi:13439_t:CDS:2 [Ambispora leptoticha]|uniref:13439_t:CDS:1 n=1 Tax=Ambispora leptoticha TaxID=144679 RepID=A0A9N8ZQW4_9GLOM|nr:13439_t:CDS:2 [Ambispora leptoticha]